MLSSLSLSRNKQTKVLNFDSLPEHVKQCEMAVAGELYHAGQARLKEGKDVIFTNIGNPQALGQRPLTFTRQVMSLCTAPHLLEHPEVHRLYPRDAIERAKTYMTQIKGGVGAYSDVIGNGYIRQECATFIEERDQLTHGSVNPNNLFLTNGASEAVRYVLKCLLRGPQDGVMVPVPQYPLYSGSIQLYNGSMVGYYLDEDKGWGLDFKQMAKEITAARRKGVTVRALVFINPGNPTGQCLDTENLQGLVRFAVDNNLVLMADEVYQENIYNRELPFISMRSIVTNMPRKYSDQVELFSFHSASKGVYGECGFRGGYVDLMNIDQAVMGEIKKLASINLSPNVPGQVIMGLMCNPPRPGDESYNQYITEKRELTESLGRRARMITDGFNECEGISCQPTNGAMYSFPRIVLPKAFLLEAQKLNKEPDVLYCLKLLAETGILSVPGSGFSQKEGTLHFRTTILPPEDMMNEMMRRFKRFHSNFMNQYRVGNARL